MHTLDTFDSRYIFVHTLQIDVCNAFKPESVLLHEYHRKKQPKHPLEQPQPTCGPISASVAALCR